MYNNEKWGNVDKHAELKKMTDDTLQYVRCVQIIFYRSTCKCSFMTLHSEIIGLPPTTTEVI